MKNILSFLVLIPVLIFGQTQSENYIKTTTYKVASATSIVTPTSIQASQNITYFDGLGRPIQQIANQQSGTGKDIVTPIEYDAFGRQAKEYLPYVPTTAASLDYKSTALTDVLNYSQYIGQNPFSQKQLESSPLNRVLKQAAPGTITDWALNSGHEIKLDYQTNTSTDAVKLFSVTATASYDIPTSLTPASYADFQLYKTITYDENTPLPSGGAGGGTVEFKNKQGQVILKRTYDNSIAHNTYYVYDQYGNLTFVIPPLVDATTTITSTILGDLCYQYKYDSRNRLIEKKLPGKQWEFIVYDKLDRVVATGPAFSPFSDASQIGVVGWLITKYDVFNRPVYTGWEQSTTVNSAGRVTKQNTINGLATISESKTTTGTIDGVTAFYTNTVAPTTVKLLTVNYYDNYTFPNVPTIPTTVEGQNVLAITKTLSTGSWVRVLTTASVVLGETTAVFYDAKARPIRTALTNYLTGYTQTDSNLDGFSGRLNYTVTKHKRTSTDTELYTKEAFTYSLQDRLLTHTHQIGTGGTPQLLAANTYDDLGQLIGKNVGNTIALPLQKINYAYNIRCWMTGINEIADLKPTTEKDLFAFKINYNTVENCVNYTGTPLYNGNISETYWRTATDNVARKYGYKYDNLNRLKASVYQKANTITPSLTTVTNKFDENLSYDKNGNIIALVRNGNSDTNVAPVYVIDNLGYNYAPSTNRLLSVTDTPTSATSGFNDRNTSGDDYTYDANGNMITDKNKSITTAITYNHLNLPTKIIISTAPTGNIVYIYNAVGQKLRKIVTQGTTSTTTDYLGGYQYQGVGAATPTLQFFPTAEGYVKNTIINSANNYSYVYNYTDHLGSVRLSYGLNANVLTVFDESNYYPFGLKHSVYNVIAPATDYKYKYNGKELQDELGLNMYDYGWRNYMPDLGRWTQIDPLFNDLKFANDINNVDEEDPQEVYMSIINDLELGGAIYNTDNLNPYGYGYNNPVSFDDPDGRCPACWGALMGAAVEIGGQVIASRLEGKSWSDTVKDIDVADVLVSAGEGALTGGASAIKSVLKKAAITVGAEVIRNTLDVKSTGVKVNGAKTVARNTVIGLAVNAAGKAIPTKVKVKAEVTPAQAVKAARAVGAVTKAERKEIQTQAKKVLKDNKAINKTVSGSPGATVSGGAAETVKRKEDKANGN